MLRRISLRMLMAMMLVGSLCVVLSATALAAPQPRAQLCSNWMTLSSVLVKSQDMSTTWGTVAHQVDDCGNYRALTTSFIGSSNVLMAELRNAQGTGLTGNGNQNVPSIATSPYATTSATRACGFIHYWGHTSYVCTPLNG